jgi:hypothetical protein
MRNEVVEFMKHCERLLALALQTKELSPDECGVITYYANELHEKIHPLCAPREDAIPGTPAGKCD